MNERQLLALRSASLETRLRGELGGLANDLAHPFQLDRHVRARPLVSVGLAALTGFCAALLLPGRSRLRPDGERSPGLLGRAFARASRITSRTLEAALVSGLTSPSEVEAPDPSAQ